MQFRHVKGHSEDPWNDLADHVAKTAAASSRKWPQPPCAICQEVMTTDISWLAPELDARVHHAVPIIDGAITWGDPPPDASLLAPMQLVPHTEVQLAPGTCLEEFTLHAVTINIQSLRAKCQYVEDQLDQRRVQVAFFQETKLLEEPRPLKITSGSTLMLNRHWGVGIWIHKVWSLCKRRQRMHHR